MYVIDLQESLHPFRATIHLKRNFFYTVTKMYGNLLTKAGEFFSEIFSKEVSQNQQLVKETMKRPSVKVSISLRKNYNSQNLL